MSLSMLSSESTLGRLARLPLALFPRAAVVPILQGRLRGKRWIVGSAIHGCWLGTYEREKQNIIAQHIDPNTTFYDIGANAGFYTLLASFLVGSGKVVAFEPLPQNVLYLKKHLELNRVSNVDVIEAAVTDREGLASFEVGESRLMGRVAASGNLTVRTIALDSLVREGEIPAPGCIKMDIEGAEVLALKGARECLRTHKPKLFLATHGRDVERECRLQLTSLGYELQNICGVNTGDRCEIFAKCRS
jgi:FkbM family methyltransferase